MTSVDIALVVLVATMTAALVAGVVAVARRAGLPHRAAPRMGAAVAVAIAAWLAVTAGLAAAGWLARWNAAPPRVAFLPVTILATMLVLSRTRRFGTLLAALPRSWPIALQTFRVPVELLLWLLYLAGRIPERMTFAGWNFDVLVGLSAPLVAWMVSRGRVPRAGILAWNVAGLALLANIVTIAVRSAPGPANAGWGGVPNTVIVEVPFVWLPAFLVPLAAFGHVVSLRQVVRSAPRSTAPRLERVGRA